MNIMSKLVRFPRFMLTLALALAFAAFAAGSAVAATSTSFCTDPVLSQPFLSSGDGNNYVLAPGQDGRGFNGSGWTLTGGAKAIGGVLDLPSGSIAASPVMCVSTDYPFARMMVRNVRGAEGVSFYVYYGNSGTWSLPKNTGLVRGKGTAWTLSDPVSIQPPNVIGWQLVRFGLVAGGKSSEFQIRDFWVDPFSRR